MIGFQWMSCLGGGPSIRLGDAYRRRVQVLDRYAEGQEADAALPQAYTCFLMLKIPKYSSKDIFAEKLRYAIRHCKAIDTGG